MSSSPSSHQRPRQQISTMIHAGTHANSARGHAVLPPIPEAQERVPPGQAGGRPDWERGPRTRSSDLSAAATPPSGESTADTDEGTELTAACIYPWHSVREWPAGQEARSRITLRACADPRAQGQGTRAVCRVRDGVLTLSSSLFIDQRSAEGEWRPGLVLAKVPVEALAVGLLRGRDDIFTVGTVHKNRVYDEIYCSADNQSKRDKWIMVFRRMGVTIYRLAD